MKHLIIYTHPNPKSFNRAIFETFRDELLERRHEVRVRDLYDMKFNPVLGPADFEEFAKGSIPRDIAAEHDHIVWADVITVIYPLWWTGLPAMVKGYFDRVFTHGFAYAYGENGLEKLLTGKKGLFLTTQGNPREVYAASGMFDAMKKTTDEGIYAFTGIETLDHIFFTSVPSVDDAKRKEYLEEVKSLVHTLF